MSQLVESEAAGHLQQRYTFLYAQAPDLRMDDVPVLLRQYKELILKHEALVCALEAHWAKQQSGTSAAQSPPTAGRYMLFDCFRSPHSQDSIFLECFLVLSTYSCWIAQPEPFASRTCCLHEIFLRSNPQSSSVGQALLQTTLSCESLDACWLRAHLPAAEATTTGQDSAANQSSEQPRTSPLSPPQQPQAPLEAAQGSGASPFSQASAQGAPTEDPDTAMPAPTPAGASSPHQPGSVPHLPPVHQPFASSADSPFQHPDEQERTSAAATSTQNEVVGNSMPLALSSSGMEAVGSGHNPSDAQVRNSLTAASQPLPPESTADIDAGGVDDRHMTISSGSALAEAVQSENATASLQGGSHKKSSSRSSSMAGASSPAEQRTSADSGTPAAEPDMFSGLHVESNGGAA